MAFVSVSVGPDVRDDLRAIKREDESYSDVLRRLMEVAEAREELRRVKRENESYNDVVRRLVEAHDGGE